MPKRPAKSARTANRTAAPSVAKPVAAKFDEPTLFRLVWEIPRFWRTAMDRRLKPLGLSEAKWRTVFLLSRNTGDVSQADLASRLNIEAPTLARLLDRLAVDGWIERRASKTDRRVKTVHLLPKASSVIRQIDRAMIDMHAEILAGLSRTELRACLQTLQLVRDRTERAARHG